MKCLLVVCDGVADRPIKALGGRTPLESAKTRNLDAIAKDGICGIVDTIAPGIRPGSDTAHLAILGYDPFTSYTGRGPFEAAGVGMDVKPGDIAFRCNFATVNEEGFVVDRRAGRIGEGTEELAKAIGRIKIPGVDISFKKSTGHRAALVISGRNISHSVSDSDPHREGVKPHTVEALDSSPAALRTAEILNRFITESRKVLESHPVNVKRLQEKKNPANILILRGAGVAPSLVPIEKRYGLKGGCIATVALVRGVGKFCGLSVLGAEPSTSIEELGKMALKATEKYDFVLLNIKSADDATHDGDTEKKIRVIEEIDSIAARFHDFAQENYLAILADHTSSITRKDHCGDPVPIVIAGPEVRTDDVSSFSERAAATGGLCRIRGIDIMNILVDLMNRSEKFGA
ncbi:MAG: 2,3-bisphosphoglycerate-independent phosphoglycerate mutase [Candidatus Hydrothermarchaeales archaeon]